MTPAARRARPLPIDDRRAALVDAVVPLLMEHGRDVTTRQIAEAAGVAEGTIFRAFGDKESLIAAAVQRYLRPDDLHARLSAIDPSLPLEEKVHTIIALLVDCYREVIRVMSALSTPGPPPHRATAWEYAETIGRLLEPDRDRLTLSPVRVAHAIRLLAFSSAIPQFSEGTDFTIDELTDLMLGGVTRPTAPAPRIPVVERF